MQVAAVLSNELIYLFSKMLAVVIQKMVVLIQVVSTVNVVDEFIQSRTPSSFFLQSDSSKYTGRAFSSSILVANVFDVLRPLKCDTSVVFLDGPPPFVCFENNKRVMEYKFRHLPAVQRMSVISHLYNVLGIVDQFHKFIAQFSIRYEIVPTLRRICFGIEIQFAGVAAGTSFAIRF